MFHRPPLITHSRSGLGRCRLLVHLPFTPTAPHLPSVPTPPRHYPPLIDDHVPTPRKRGFDLPTPWNKSLSFRWRKVRGSRRTRTMVTIPTRRIITHHWEGPPRRLDSRRNSRYCRVCTAKLGDSCETLLDWICSQPSSTGSRHWVHHVPSRELDGGNIPTEMSSTLPTKPAGGRLPPTVNPFPSTRLPSRLRLSHDMNRMSKCSSKIRIYASLITLLSLIKADP